MHAFHQVYCCYLHVNALNVSYLLPFRLLIEGFPIQTCVKNSNEIHYKVGNRFFIPFLDV